MMNGQNSVCAWCRSEYDSGTGERIRRLTDAEYDQVITHGCCPACGKAMLAEYAAARIPTQEQLMRKQNEDYLILSGIMPHLNRADNIAQDFRYYRVPSEEILKRLKTLKHSFKDAAAETQRVIEMAREYEDEDVNN